jgi:hypothetical protein
MNANWSGKLLAIVAVFATTLVPSAAAQDKREGICGGLHAAIRAELFGATRLRHSLHS